ncbi:MAG: RsiV family protein [Lachnospiraceae bacterium]|nr:RsiV family protein [Lachnospiraceae bacterium]
MKKFTVGIIAGILILSLTTACLPTVAVNGGDKDSNSGFATIEPDDIKDSGNDNDANTTDNTDNGNDGSTVNANGNDASDSPYADYPEYSVWQYPLKNETFTDPEGKTRDKVMVSYDSISINSYEDNGFVYKELSDSIKEYNKELEETLQTTFDGLLKDWNEYYSDVEEGSYIPTLYEIVHMGVVRADKQVFSIAINDETYYGGAHGGNYPYGVTFDSQTGKQIALSDVIIKNDGLNKIIVDELYENYDKEIFFAEDRDELEKEVQEYLNDGLGWTINYEGVSFYFGDYALAAYASGHQVVYINYDKYPEYLNADYFENADKEYVVRVSADVYYPYTVNGKESYLWFDWEKKYIEESGYYSDTYQYLNIGNNEFYQQLDMDGSFIDPGLYIIRKNGKDFLYLQNYFYDGVEFLQTFEIQNGKFVSIGEYDGGISFNTNELVETIFDTNIPFTGNFEFAWKNARVTDNGTLEPKSNIFRYHIYKEDLDSEESWKTGCYEVLEDIEGYAADEEGDLLDDKLTLKKGSKVLPFSTDGSTFITVLCSDGKKYAFNAKFDDSGRIFINNKNTYDLFDYISEW